MADPLFLILSLMRQILKPSFDRQACFLFTIEETFMFGCYCHLDTDVKERDFVG